ncbi:UvrD-helicase domain-containing protein [Paenibacillus sp. Cedars]|uniref:UvrD-helicase domain-containing protein n=1 Tax=Paenibacillus sp. Cedars TaxID=1980674 RepID=UPI001163DF8A|nr:ATP-dependent helicase [Paenibacillus sp. Cedars]AWP28479.1 DNA helicase UvrD [Paenibacillus sp. Cedars]
MFELSDQKKRLLNTNGPLLILGGPGSGKTTIALLKANQIIEQGGLSKGQLVLFLSFARATVSRVEEQVGQMISTDNKKHIEVNTYHGFIWGILRSHGYLLNSKSPLKLLTPPEAASRFANISNEQKAAEKKRLFDVEGIVHFDLFASLGAELLSRSNSLARIISDAYPVVILDEFQDTNLDEWSFIKELGKRSRLIALADAEQRIYEFRGADPARISEFIKQYSPQQFDFGSENNRSSGTDIATFGNDLLAGRNKEKKYNNVQIVTYPFRKGDWVHFDVKVAAIKAVRKLIAAGQKSKWSVAVLVPTKRLMIEVSDYFSETQNIRNKTLRRIPHEVALETTGPSLAAILIGELLDLGVAKVNGLNQLIKNLCEHIRGRNGNEPPSKANLELSTALLDYLATGKIRGTKRQSIINDCKAINDAIYDLEYSGNPSEDWIQIVDILSKSSSDVIKQVVVDSKYLRILHKGSELRSSLSTLWRSYGSYRGAGQAIRLSLLQEYFSSSTKEYRGIHIMTIHKSKGKEFDEVIIYEGLFQGKIVNTIGGTKSIEQSRLSLRVGVTRARQNTTIITPASDMCPFL